MIGYLEGTARGRVLHTASGVGYQVQTPRQLPQGQVVRLHVTTVVREDAITLYGFVEEAEQLLFEALCRVTGVGAASALAVVRDAGVAAVVAAVTARDITRLGRIKGVGPKTAARIISDLRLPDGLSDVHTETEVDDELVNTLVTLGFDRATATEAVVEALAGTTGEDEEEVLASALASLRAGAR